MFRSKSCMNGCFQKLGYTVCRPSQDLSSIFAQMLPGHGNHAFVPRQWCVRRAGEGTTARFTPCVDIEFAPGSNPVSLPLSPLSASEEEDQSVVSIEFLLNHPRQIDTIHRMTCNPLPPLRL
jgi:hypothetical protein